MYEFLLSLLTINHVPTELVFLDVSQSFLTFLLRLFCRSQLKCHPSRTVDDVCRHAGLLTRDREGFGRTVSGRSRSGQGSGWGLDRCRGGRRQEPPPSSRDGIRPAPASRGCASPRAVCRGRGQAESRGSVAYALLGRGKMADGKGDAAAAAAAGAGGEAPAGAGAGDRSETESLARSQRPASPAPGAPGLRPCLWQLETELREQEVSEVSSLNYCRSFCQVKGWLVGRGGGAGRPGKRPRIHCRNGGRIGRRSLRFAAPPGREGPARKLEHGPPLRPT